MAINLLRAVKSNAGSMKESVVSKFRKAPELPTYPSPLGFRIGAAVTLDDLEFRALGDKLRMEFPGGTQIIEAYGKIEMGDGIIVHRFYTTDDAMFQITTDGGDNVDEVKLFVAYDTVFPASGEEWGFWVDETEGVIGDPEFEIKDGTNFTRAWFEDSEGHVPMVDVEETVVTNAETGESFLVEHGMMLYARWVDDSEEMAEWLLLGVEDTGESASVELMLGVDLDESSFDVT